MSDTIKILLIEDDEVDAWMIQRHLRNVSLKEESGSGAMFDLIWRNSLSSGLQFLTQEDVDAVLLDLNLSDSIGLETFSQIHKNFAKIPILILTGLCDRELATRAVREGAQDYLIKGQLDGRLLDRCIRYSIERNRAQEALSESEKKYRLLINNAKESIIVAQDGLLKFVNPMTLELLEGYSERELIDRPFPEFIHPDDRSMVVENYRRRLAKDAALPRYAFRVVTRAGIVKWVEIHAALIEWQGKPASLNFLTDITERKRAESEREEAHSRLLKIARRVPGLVYQYRLRPDGSSCIPFASDAIHEIFRVSPDEVREDASKAFANIHPDDYSGVVASLQASAQELSPWQYEFRVKFDDGTIRTLYANTLPEREEDGSVLWHGFITDITERKRAEEALAFTYIILRTQQELSIDGILVVDENGKILSYNPRFVDMWRIPADIIESQSDELALQSVMDKLASPEDFMQKVKHLYEFQDEISSDEVTLKDGRLFDRYSAPMLGASGKYYGRVWYFRDITERKQAEKVRERLLTELESKNTEMERFIYTVSHDLRSPLVTINGFVGFLESDLAKGSSERVKVDLKMISSAINKMERLLKDTLELSRVGRVANPPKLVPFAEIVQEALDQVHEKIVAKGVRVTIHPYLPSVNVDRMRIVEVLTNLMENSIKYIGDQPHPSIEVGHRLDGEETVFFVKDNGMGIDPGQHDKIFGLFYKVDKKSEGSGAGLAIIKRIIEVHGGRIWIESALGKGCTVCFTLASPNEEALVNCI
jgi:PAS domain S-box-containing protein